MSAIKSYADFSAEHFSGLKTKGSSENSHPWHVPDTQGLHQAGLGSKDWLDKTCHLMVTKEERTNGLGSETKNLWLGSRLRSQRAWVLIPTLPFTSVWPPASPNSVSNSEKHSQQCHLTRLFWEVNGAKHLMLSYRTLGGRVSLVCVGLNRNWEINCLDHKVEPNSQSLSRALWLGRVVQIRNQTARMPGVGSSQC